MTYLVNIGYEFRDALCTCKLRAAKYGERVGPAKQVKHATTANFDLGLSGLSPLPHILFHQLQGLIVSSPDPPRHVPSENWRGKNGHCSGHSGRM